MLKVISPTQIFIDLNNNGIANEHELITLENIRSFSTKPSKMQSQLAHELKITNEDALGFGFLAENFAKETLENKKIKLIYKNSYVPSGHFLNKFPLLKAGKMLKLTRFAAPTGSQISFFDCSLCQVQHDIIYIDNKNYENILLERGFALEKGKAPSAQFEQNLQKVQKLNLRIFNNKSLKYHKLDCKYGLMAHNSQIIPAFQLPKDAKPCKFCFSKQKVKSRIGLLPHHQKTNDVIPYVESPATIYQTNSIKIFLTDFTKTLKPNNNCNTDVCKTLVNEINQAQNSIDFAIYGYTKVPAIQQALENAQRRRVKVRFIYDLDEKNNNIYPDTNYLAEILTNNQHDLTNQLMHDKFFIFDGKKVLTGSANISNTDMSGFNSNVVILINSEKIADIYTREFEQMFSGKFHTQKSKIDDKSEIIDDSEFQVCFSPADTAITEKIIPLIDNTHKYIYMPAFLLTHKKLAASLINASNRGVSIKLILDATNTHVSSSKLKLLRQHGIQVKTENFAGKIHSKSIIIDDLYTIIGSMNFSRSGENVNDENLIIIKNPEIAVFYKTFFQYLWKRIPDKWLKYNARAESWDSIGSCSDGIDNNFDGKIDKEDKLCRAGKKRKVNGKW
ncbi:MAG: phospholipase D-like domain-containing protein [Candidatus Gastranaerophilales bacterium]|nr:phospholipase D-like domain-containing protein [Candidatus Gastranaerophilales bacterium]